ncbi:MAG: MBL fold metallo-hydrolase, partial [Gemmatimonadaceae bacterium]|nr:MBL fold metallo-hydrolase [Gemmatimonadaceae bacterium]
MLLRRIYHERLAQASYLLACQSSGEAVVVDPLRDAAPYLELAQREHVRITHVVETHVHADYVSGAAALARAAGATLMLSGEGDPSSGYRLDRFAGSHALHDGDRFQVGAIRFDVLHVPGHTPEHLAFLVTDTAAVNVPMGMLSGDFVFVGDVGRPDLLERSVGVQGSMERSARALYRSLQRLRDLPDHLQLWPGHGPGSACGKALGAVPQSTLGYERLSNWAFTTTDEGEFVRTVLAGQPDPPAYFARMKSLNPLGGLPMPSAVRLDLAALRAAIGDGALVVDVRRSTDFATGHRTGAINLPLGGAFLGWAGSVLPHDRDVVLVSSPADTGPAEEARRDLVMIGLDRVLGVLPVMDADREDRCSTIRSLPAATLEAEEDGPLILDVRGRAEWEAGHIPGAAHLPLQELVRRLDELPRDRAIVVHCQGGSRSAIAASILQAAGHDVLDGVGGYV